MKKNELVDLINKNPGNMIEDKNDLTNQLIMKIIDDNTDKETQEVNELNIYIDLGCALNRIENAVNILKKFI